MRGIMSSSYEIKNVSASGPECLPSRPAPNEPSPAPLSQKAATFGIAGLILYAFVRNVLVSASKPLWFDEIGTWIVARQPNLSMLWKSLKSGADGNPPALHVIEHFALPLFSNQELASR